MNSALKQKKKNLMGCVPRAKLTDPNASLLTLTQSIWPRGTVCVYLFEAAAPEISFQLTCGPEDLLAIPDKEF